jgi:hypothetical protein
MPAVEGRRAGAEDKYKDCQYFGILIRVVVRIKHAYGDVWDEWVLRL